MAESIVSIISIIFTFLFGLIAITISLYSLKKVLENSYPVIDTDIKLKRERSADITVRNTGKSIAYDIYVYFDTGWGKAEPDRINIAELVPGYYETRNIQLPADKKGAVYFLELHIDGNRKNFCNKKKALPQQIKKLEFDREDIITPETRIDFLEL